MELTKTELQEIVEKVQGIAVVELRYIRAANMGYEKGFKKATTNKVYSEALKKAIYRAEIRTKSEFLKEIEKIAEIKTVKNEFKKGKFNKVKIVGRYISNEKWQKLKAKHVGKQCSQK